MVGYKRFRVLVPSTLPASARFFMEGKKPDHRHPPSSPRTGPRLQERLAPTLPAPPAGQLLSQEIQHRGSPLIFQEKPEIQVLK